MSFGDLFSSASEDQKVRGEKPKSGVHLLGVANIKLQATRKLGRMAEFRFVVLKTTNPEMEIGSQVVEVFFPEDTRDPDLIEANRGRLRSMVRAVAGLPNNASPEEVSDAWEDMSDEAQSARGVKVRCTGTDLVSKKGLPFVGCTYESLPQTEEDIKATRAQIESVSFESQAVAEMNKGGLPDVLAEPVNELPPGLAARLRR